MSIITNTYHGCQITSDLRMEEHTVVCDGKTLGTCGTLADAVYLAKHRKPREPAPSKPVASESQEPKKTALLDKPKAEDTKE